MDRFPFDLSQYRRRKTVTVRVGGLCIGGDYPVRIQSMANTDTNDTQGCIEQALRIVQAGGELVRFTAQGRREAENLKAIKDGLRERGCDVPLVADIHFNPEAAFIAARIVEKVRINPGNFIHESPRFSQTEYSEEEYRQELGKLREKLVRLIDICKAHGTALRIGVNHGSLSNRIMSRYGDTPAGMVESALEFLRVCVREQFDQVVISIKSSNVRVMVHAYRLLVLAMDTEGMAFPLHLGVTEAGDGEEARVKSAVGIGALLADGLGDTIRVSLTEPPENEIPVARKLAGYFVGREKETVVTGRGESFYDPYDYKRRETEKAGPTGGGQVPVVIGERCGNDKRSPDFTPPLKVWTHLNVSRLEELSKTLVDNPGQLVLMEDAPYHQQRALFLAMQARVLRNPVIIQRNYAEYDLEMLQLKAAADIGPLLLDGYGDGIYINNTSTVIPAEQVNSLSFAILQATRVRMTRTEYIACPGCGRTLFNLTETLAQVRAATSHLTGLKIAVMGCIVNGPGEMADADYGYVGAGPGKITLYKGKEVIERNIPQQEAIPRLLDLIDRDKIHDNPDKDGGAAEEKKAKMD